MKMRHIKWGLFLFLLAITATSQASPAAWAGDSGWAGGHVVDYSVNMLSAIFGKVGTALDGGPTIAQQIFKIFNFGIFSVMSLFVGYNIFHHAISASATQAMQGENAKIPLSFFRTLIAICLLVPVSYYNGIEVITMQCVVQGTKFANWVYHEALDAVYNNSVPIVYIAQGSNIALGANAGAFDS
ncbi:MAG: hypothetical protein ABGY11_03620, partial [Candidatus Thioglobus sp.]